MHTHTHSLSLTHTLSLSHTHTLSLSLSHTLSHTHTHTHSLSLSLTLSHTQCTLTLTLSLTHTHTISLSHTHSLSHSHTHTLSLSHTTHTQVNKQEDDSSLMQLKEDVSLNLPPHTHTPSSHTCPPSLPTVPFLRVTPTGARRSDNSCSDGGRPQNQPRAMVYPALWGPQTQVRHAVHH